MQTILNIAFVMNARQKNNMNRLQIKTLSQWVDETGHAALPKHLSCSVCFRGI